MFCDLAGSTELSARYDSKDLSDIVRNYQNTTESVVDRYDGHIAHYMSDGILTYFGYPRAHEDDAERALRPGLDIIREVVELEPRRELRLHVRIGVATGSVVVGETIGSGSSLARAYLAYVRLLHERRKTERARENLALAKKLFGTLGMV